MSGARYLRAPFVNMTKYKRLNSAILKRIRTMVLQCPEDLRREGFCWYGQANKLCQEIYLKYCEDIPTLTHEGTVGILSALSPGQEWSRNIESTTKFLDAFMEGKRGPELPNSISPYGFRNILKCESIALGQEPLEVLGGPKVRAFYSCIVDPIGSTDVVVDRHARCLALGLARTEKNGIVRSLGEYRYIARHYATIARSYELMPMQVQAVTWLYWRENF